MSTHATTVFAEPGKQELLITREFDAPRELVFKVCTDPKPGGQWRFINRDAEGHVYAFHGVYHEICAPERVIDTFEFEGLPEAGHVTLETMKLEELPGGRTRLTTQSVFQSIADRDATLQSGMESGINDTYNRLEELLEKFKQTQ